MSGPSDRLKDSQDCITVDNTKILNVMPQQLAARIIQYKCFVMSMQSQPGVDIPKDKKSGAVQC